MSCQNELFQREVRQAMGGAFQEDYLQQARSARNQTQRAGGSQQPPPAASSSELPAIPDMGLLRALQGMSGAVKSQLHQLALQFNSSTSAQDKDKADADLQDESRPLTAANYEVRAL